MATIREMTRETYTGENGRLLLKSSSVPVDIGGEAEKNAVTVAVVAELALPSGYSTAVNAYVKDRVDSARAKMKRKLLI